MRIVHNRTHSNGFMIAFQIFLAPTNVASGPMKSGTETDMRRDVKRMRTGCPLNVCTVNGSAISTA